MLRVLDGAFADFVLVPEVALIRKPANETYESAALIKLLAGCSKGLIEYSQLRLGEDLVIIGAGSIGMLATMVAARAGAGVVIVASIDDWHLQLAARRGATHLVNSAKVEAKQAAYGILPEGHDAVFEESGRLTAEQLAFDLCRPGTRINEFGVTTAGTITVSPSDLHWEETRVDASFSVHPAAMSNPCASSKRGWWTRRVSSRTGSR